MHVQAEWGASGLPEAGPPGPVPAPLGQSARRFYCLLGHLYAAARAELRRMATALKLDMPGDMSSHGTHVCLIPYSMAALGPKIAPFGHCGRHAELFLECILRCWESAGGSCEASLSMVLGVRACVLLPRAEHCTHLALHTSLVGHLLRESRLISDLCCRAHPPSASLRLRLRRTRPHLRLQALPALIQQYALLTPP